MVNSGSLATATFPGADGIVDYHGDTAIAGVPGTAAAVMLDFGRRWRTGYARTYPGAHRHR